MKEKEKEIKGKIQDYWLTQLCGWGPFSVIGNTETIKGFAEIWYVLFDVPVWPPNGSIL